MGEDAAELSTAREELRGVEQELRERNEALLGVQLELAAERTPYRELFELAPIAYLVTDRDVPASCAPLRATTACRSTPWPGRS